MNVEVRDAAPDEDALILRITLDAYGEFADVMAPSAWMGLERAIRRTLESPTPARKLVALDGERVVGSVLLFPANVDAYGGALPPLPYPEVRLLAVHPSARGSGVGQRLMEECIRRAREGGAIRMGIHTSESMRAARAMYRKMGFVRNPTYDFHPPGAELVEAHTLDL